MNAAATPRTLCWLRGDLRIDDNPALAAAVAQGGVITGGLGLITGGISAADKINRELFVGNTPPGA